MKKLIMTTAALAMFASGPAFAGCGAHGGGYGRAYSAPAYATPKYSAATRAVAARPAPAAKPTKVAALQRTIQSDGGGSSDEGEAKAQPTVAPVKTAEAPLEAAVETAVPAAEQRECKKYSPTMGGMITVPCE